MADHPHHHPEHEVEHVPSETDPASRSLADALRVSFALLTFIMVVVALFYLGTGVATIEPHQAGIKKVFGKRVGPVAREGLAYTWPFPIGEIELVSIKEQKLSIDDFWLHETPEDKTKELSARRARVTSSWIVPRKVLSR